MDVHSITSAEVAKDQFIKAHQKFCELRGIHLTFSGIIILSTLMAVVAASFGQINGIISFILIVGYVSFAIHFLSFYRTKKELLQLKVWLESNGIRIGKKKGDTLAKVCFVDVNDSDENYDLTSPSITVMSEKLDFKEYNKLFEIR